MNTPTVPNKQPTTTNMKLLRGLALLLLAGTPWLIYIAGRYYFESRDMENWPRTVGQITSHKVYDNPENQHGPTYSVYVNFQYRVEGTLHRAERVEPGSNTMSASERDKLLAQYPVGSQHDVYYSRSDPEWAYLKPGLDTQALAAFAGSCAAPLVILVLLAFSCPAPVDPNSLGAKWANWGLKLLGLFACCLIIGGAISRLFFSEAMGKGIPTGLWFVLVPIWTIGLLGVLLWTAGRLKG